MGRIRLDSLQLTGFKSFADGVKLSFPENITAIIGPNGCGKSNIVDAILWALGEQSPSLLRLKTMADLVFSGTSRRQPAGAAEAVLTLSSDDGRWEATEGRLDISRRVLRSGPSEYRLNGKTVRLKDVIDELLGVGLGTRSYAIIGQDRVSQVLTARPTDRRILLEEAAGITRYKVHKHDAELKLEHTRQNLQRLDDVISEVDRSLRQLKRQSKQAERYTRIEAELRDALRALLTFKTHRLDAQRNRLRADRIEVEDATASSASGLAGAEADLATARRQLDQERVEVEKARAEVATLLTSRERLETFLERSADLLDSLRTSLERSRNQAKSLGDSRQTLAESLVEAGSRLDSLGTALADVEKRREAAALSEKELREALASAEATAEGSRQELLRVISALTSSRNRVRDLEREQDRLAYAKRQLEQENERQLSRRSEVRERLATARAESSEAATAAAELALQRDDFAHRRSEIAEAASAAGAAAEDLGHRAWEARHRLAGIDRELARHTAVLEQIDAVIPDEALAGQVSDYLQPEPGAAQLLDRVWRERLQLPVLRLADLPEEVLERARALEARLRLVLAADPPAAPAEVEIADAQPLLPLAGIPDEERGWLMRVLPPAYRCRDAQAARRLAEAHPEAVFLAPNGTLFRGRSVEPETGGSRLKGFLALREDKETLTAEIASLGAEADEERARQTRLKDEAASLDQEADAVAQSLVAAEQVRARAAAVEQALAEELQRLEHELEALESEAGRNTSDQEAATARRDQLEAEVERLEKRSSELEAAVDRASEQVDTKRHEAGEAVRELDRWRAEERLARERVEAAGADRGRLSDEQLEIDARLASFAEEIARLEAKLSDTEGEIVSSRARLAEEQGLLAAAKNQERHLASKVEATVARVARLEKEVGRRRSEHETVRARLHELDVERTRLDAEWEQIHETAAAELGETLQALLETAHADDADEPTLRSKVEDLRARLERLGPVNLLAVQETEELGERSAFLHGQREDLVSSLRSLGATIREIDATCMERFVDTFVAVNTVFGETFCYLFGGGTARLDLADEDDPLESGILISAQPPGKKNQSVQLLSGGEKALTALSLLIALFRVKPSPVCILDEVDAPLDDANVERLADLVRDMTEHTQFVLITHNRRTMTRANILYGVTMEEAGVSKVVSVRMEEE
ncbi:MAG: chromosome segregation protein SMC [Acidobacteria bacterium]|nr:chromosome segregation protein SMC [Acidobacteriota bacterium]